MVIQGVFFLNFVFHLLGQTRGKTSLLLFLTNQKGFPLFPSKKIIFITTKGVNGRERVWMVFFSPLIFLIWGGATIEGKGHFLCCFLFLQGADTMKRKITSATNTLENSYFDYMVFLFFFQNFLSTLKFWLIKAIYMCRLLQL